MYSSFHPYFGFSAVIPHLRSVRLPPQNSAGAKKLGGRSTARKNARLVQLTISVEKQNPH
ncbi:hypothetical protein EXW58_08435 [Bacillus mycoides]|nr:hypothetical protein EXW58_08435 [Bacillus mycoides]